MEWYDNCSGYWEENERAAGGDMLLTPGWQGFSYSCQSTGPGIWSRATQGGYSFSLSGGITIAHWIGINLSMNTAYDSSRILSYRILDNTSMCGNDNVPSMSAQVSEE
jgi:hypothetical protein